MTSITPDLRLFDHPYAAFLDRVEKPARYTGAEHGSRKKDWSSVACRIALAFPDVYEIGMSHLGYRILYQVLNDHPRLLAERCYCPWLDMRAELVARGLPLVSLESARPLSAFDIVGFSLQFELCHTNLLLMLELGGIARRSTERAESAPLILGGGPGATHPEPVAPFFDALAIGEGEELFVEIAERWAEGLERGESRAARLRGLSTIPGVYVPSLYQTRLEPRTGLQVVVPSEQAPIPIRRRVVSDLARFPFPASGPVGGPESVFDRTSIEVARGCTEGCRFCQAGMIYRPARERSPEEVIGVALNAIRLTGQDEVSLTALSTADLSYVGPLLTRLAPRLASDRVSLGVASLRAYGLAPELLDSLRKMRASGLTFAPEAGSQRLRDVINKNVTDEQLLDTARMVFSRGWDKMKLYFILGLPTETDDDIRGIVELGSQSQRIGKPLTRGRASVTLSVSVHVPKPHTPFQWCAMDSLVELERKQQLLLAEARRHRGVSLRLHDPKASLLEGVIARGDRRVADVIERAYQLGALFDSWDDQFHFELWEQAFREAGFDPRLCLNLLDREALLPWSHIDVGITPSFLRREYDRALCALSSAPCTKPLGLLRHPTTAADAAADTRPLVCHACGIACLLPELREHRNAALNRIEKLLDPGQTGGTPPVAATDGTTPTATDGAEPAASEAEQPTATGNAEKTVLTGMAEPVTSVVGLEPSRATRYRLRYQKLGPAALLGHLDLIRELPRILRRAALPVAYSRGFHPKPELSFVTALSVGIPSLDEYVDVMLLESLEPRELLQRLADTTTEGLRFIDAVALEQAALNLAKSIGGARYAIALANQEHLSIPSLEERVNAWLARTSSPLTRTIGKKTKTIDVRALVLGLEVDPSSAREAIAQAGILGDHLCLEAEVVIAPEGSVKPSEIVCSLFDGSPVSWRAVRAEFLTTSGQPLAVTLRAGSPKP